MLSTIVRASIGADVPAGQLPRERRQATHLLVARGNRWLKTIEVFNEAGERHQLTLFPSDVAPPADDAEVAQILVQRVRVERTRQLGPCLLGLTLWRQLQLDDFFAARVDQADADVPWSRIAAILAINRLCAPGSELAIEERWYPTTALEDLLHIPDGKVNDSRLYRALDQLLPHGPASATRSRPK